MPAGRRRPHRDFHRLAVPHSRARSLQPLVQALEFRGRPARLMTMGGFERGEVAADAGLYQLHPAAKRNDLFNRAQPTEQAQNRHGERRKPGREP
jgi:hypothetical protein